MPALSDSEAEEADAEAAGQATEASQTAQAEADQPGQDAAIAPEEGVNPDDLTQALEAQFAGMNIGNILLQDVQPGAGDTHVCRSTHGPNGIGCGWNGFIYTAASGQTYDSRQRAPGACFNCGGDHFRRFCPYRRN